MMEHRPHKRPRESHEGEGFAEGFPRGGSGPGFQGRGGGRFGGGGFHGRGGGTFAGRGPGGGGGSGFDMAQPPLMPGPMTSAAGRMGPMMPAAGGGGGQMRPMMGAAQLRSGGGPMGPRAPGMQPMMPGPMGGPGMGGPGPAAGPGPMMQPPQQPSMRPPPGASGGFGGPPMPGPGPGPGFGGFPQQQQPVRPPPPPPHPNPHRPVENKLQRRRESRAALRRRQAAQVELSPALARGPLLEQLHAIKQSSTSGPGGHPEGKAGAAGPAGAGSFAAAVGGLRRCLMSDVLGEQEALVLPSQPAGYDPAAELGAVMQLYKAAGHGQDGGGGAGGALIPSKLGSFLVPHELAAGLQQELGAQRT